MSEVESSIDIDTPVAFPIQRPGLLGVPPIYQELRARCPVAPAIFSGGNKGWLVTRHADVKQVTRDTRFSSFPGDPNWPRIHQAQTSAALANGSIIAMDPPQHEEHRKLISSWFTNSSAERYREPIRASVDEIIDGMLELPQPVDLVSQFTLTLPMWVVCLLFGVPAEMRDLITERTGIRLTLDAPREKVEKATRELQDAIKEIVEDKRANPADDMFTEIVKAEQEGKIAYGEMIDMMQLLIVAGHETTSNAISLSVVALLEHPDQLEAMMADKSLLKPTVEELLRFLSITEHMCPRVAKDDIEVAGHVIQKDEGVRALVHSANFDETVFDDAETFDIRRPNPQRHLSFGFGPHVCIGQAYARMEMQEGLWQLFTRLHGLRLAVPIDELDVKRNAGVFGLNTLPVVWDSAD